MESLFKYCDTCHMREDVCTCEEMDYDFEMDSTSPEDGGQTLCGKLDRQHRMKRVGPMFTGCVYPGCNGRC